MSKSMDPSNQDEYYPWDQHEKTRKNREMETLNPQKAAMWIDQSHALLVGYLPNHPFVVEEIESPIENQVRFEGETSDKTRFMNSQGGPSNNENKKNNQDRDRLNKYFKELEKKVSGIEELLLVGPGIIKAQFFKQIRDNKKFITMKILMKDAEKMSYNQFLEMVKVHFATNN
ncbi:hypothetical protein [Algoriphagus limi]|uniref:Protein required for attachment to host cells n=1 Tax=Algoriphagus limi TaxID=2975273 RepID=A0ABT2G8F2_9BACT|nr:hypothetical protein [Algoriphagus limi]MCS5490222.1 hypothetical protein [Algoriphagus limi]